MNKDIFDTKDSPFAFLDKAAEDNDALGALMNLVLLPDEKFNLLYESVLETFERSMNDPTTKALLVQSFTLTGVSIDTLNEYFEEYLKKLEEELSDLSKNKIDYIKRIVSIIVKVINDGNGISKRIVPIPVELCNENAKLPKYARYGDAGMDVYATEDIVIHPGETKIIPTGLKMAIPLGYAILVHPRSGLSAKSKMRVANSIGLIDSGYRDEIGVIIENIDPPIKDFAVKADGTIVPGSILFGSDMHISKGERFAQLRLVETPICAPFIVDSVKDIGVNRKSGFGGTGEK